MYTELFEVLPSFFYLMFFSLPQVTNIVKHANGLSQLPDLDDTKNFQTQASNWPGEATGGLPADPGIMKHGGDGTIVELWMRRGPEPHPRPV